MPFLRYAQKYLSYKHILSGYNMDKLYGIQKKIIGPLFSRIGSMSSGIPTVPVAQINIGALDLFREGVR